MLRFVLSIKIRQNQHIIEIIITNGLIIKHNSQKKRALSRNMFSKNPIENNKTAVIVSSTTFKEYIKICNLS